MKKRLSLILLNIFLCLSALAVVCGYTATAMADGPEYTVKFWLDEGKTQEYEDARQTVSGGDCAVVPVTPTKEDNFFLYWKLGTEKFSFKTPITENVDLTAEWLNPDGTVTVTEMFSVKFVVDGTVVNEQSVGKGEDAMAPTGFDVPDGKLFLNWDRAFNNVQTDIVVNANLTDAEYTVKVIGFDDAEIATISGIRYGDPVDTTSIVIPPVSNYHVDESDKFTGNVDCVTSDGEIYVNYIPNEYTATFKIGEEIYGAVQTVNYGEYVECPTIPEKQGYIFKGWYIVGAEDTAFDFNTIIEENVTLFAKYQMIENKKYDVTFYNYDGIQYGAVQRVEEGKTAIPAGRPAREGYDFLGWFISGETRTPYDFDTPVTEDLSLNAIFRIKEYTVTVMSDGEVISTQTVKYGGNATEPQVTVKEGYIFTGFDASFKDIRKDITINATFRLKTFAVMFIDSNGKKMCATQYVEYGKSAKAPKIPAMEGYNFVGWSEDYENITDDTVVVPLYEIIKYTVEYYDDDILYDTKEVEYGRLALNIVPEQEGYIFKGWFTDEGCDPFYAYDFNTPVKDNLMLFGAWELKPAENYTVTFKIDGAIYAMYSVESGQNCPDPAVPNKYGYIFTGWDGDYSNVTSDLVINATFTEQTFNVYFRGYQGAGAQDITVKYGDFITEDLLPDSVPDKEGYTFGGFDYDASKPVTQDITIYAIYNINVYTVTFMVEGNVYEVQYVNYNSHANVPNQPEISGKQFKGWFVDGTETSFNFRDGVTADVTVTAKLSAMTRKVFYYLDSQLYSEQSVEVGTAFTALDEPDLPELTEFSGWTGLPEDMIMPNANVNVYGYTYTHQLYYVKYYIKGTLYAEIPYYDGEDVTIYSAPSEEELARLTDKDTVFIGWDDVPSVMPANDVTVNAVLKKRYTVTYYIAGYYTEQLGILEGETVPKKEAPRLPDGVVFMGWDDEDLDVMPAHDVLVTGTIMKNYTIRYYVNGRLYMEVDVFQGDPVETLPLPTGYEGFVVDGWDGEPDVMPTEDVDVNAIIRLKYTITYYIDGDVCGSESIPVGDAIPEFIPETGEYVEFVSWRNLPKDGKMPAENIEVYANVNHYFTLTYFVDGEQIDQFIILEGATITPYGTPKFEDPDTIFDGWENEPEIMPSYDVEVYGTTHQKEVDPRENCFVLRKVYYDEEVLVLSFVVTEDVNIAGFRGSIVFDDSAFTSCDIDVLDSDYTTAIVDGNEVRFIWSHGFNVTEETPFITITLTLSDSAAQENAEIYIDEAYSFDENGDIVFTGYYAVPVYGNN